MTTLYSTGCPNCRILKQKLEDKGVSYKENNSVSDMIAKGFTHVPMLEVDDKIYNFNEALLAVKEM